MINHNYYFSYLNNNFCLYRFDYEIKNQDEIGKLNMYMLYNGYKVNKIILNKDNSIVTRNGYHFYILVLLEYNSKRLINFKDIITYNNRIANINILNRTNWLELWSKKIDNIEYSIKHLMHKYRLIYNSIYYYIGLTENALTYLKLININNKNISISHKRVSAFCTLSEFYNPLNLIIDFRIRDLAEYIKAAFFEKRMTVLDIINYLKRIKMQDEDYVYFYIRMLYPSYYFDLYDLVILEKIKEEKILNITLYQEDYEYLLYEIYLLIRSHINIVGIEWINKKFIN